MALVPTMGALHDGHLSLVNLAQQHADHVVVSIFVNPTQFGPGEDYEQYPRSLRSDVEMCRQEMVSVVFAPDFPEMYGTKEQARHQYITFRITKMTEHLCGPFRPGHFEGVLQVVNKLFNIVQPDLAVFGQKDIQQWFLIRQLAVEQDHPIEILMGPTRREPDGLAKSSRNVYLSGPERKAAPMLFQALQRVGNELEKKGTLEAIPVDKAIISVEVKRLGENGFNVEYFSVVSTPDLQPAGTIEPGQTYVIAVAARLGKTRLIDNLILSHKDFQNHDA